MPGFRQSVNVWRRSWHCCIWDCFPSPFQDMQRCVVEEQGREPANVASKVCQLEWLHGPINACANTLVSSLRALRPDTEYSCCYRSMLSGEIYLRLKPHLVVRISSNIVTEHCCQVCVLSIMFCRSDSRLCADMVVSDCTIGNTSLYCVIWHSDRPTWDMKNIICIWYSHFILLLLLLKWMSD